MIKHLKLKKGTVNSVILCILVGKGDYFGSANLTGKVNGNLLETIFRLGTSYNMGVDGYRTREQYQRAVHYNCN